MFMSKGETMSNENKKVNLSQAFYKFFQGLEDKGDNCAQCHYTPSEPVQGERKKPVETVNADGEREVMCPSCFYVMKGAEVDEPECPQCHYHKSK